MNAAMVLSETPANAVADMKTVNGCAKTGSENKGPSEFKKKLEDCVILEDESPYGLPTVTNQINGNNDNSMATDSVAKQATPEIVGILEGFGLLLDYQPDALQASTANAQPVHTMTSNESAAETASLPFVLPEGAQESGAFEQYARMLSNGQFGLLGKDEQQAIIKAVGEYLGSLESTNKNQISVPKTQDAHLATETVQTDTATSEDKLISMLMKLKTLQSDKAAASTEELPMEPVKTAETGVIPDRIQPIKAAVPSTTADQVGVNMPESAAKSADAMPEQPAKTDAVMQPGLPTGAAVAQEVSPAEPNVQPAKAAQSDFIKDNVMRIVDKMSTQTSQGRYDFDVELKPDFLGKVNIKITMENGEFRMQIKTEDLGVKGLFTDQTSAMQSALKEKGIAVSNIDVTYQSQMQDSDGHKSFRDGNAGFAKKQSSRTHASLEQIMSGGFYGTITETPGYGWGGSSVEYLA